MSKKLTDNTFLRRVAQPAAALEKTIAEKAPAEAVAIEIPSKANKMESVVKKEATVMPETSGAKYIKRTYAIREDLLARLEEKKWELRLDQKDIINMALEAYLGGQ